MLFTTFVPLRKTHHFDLYVYLGVFATLIGRISMCCMHMGMIGFYGDESFLRTYAPCMVHASQRHSIFRVLRVSAICCGLAHSKQCPFLSRTLRSAFQQILAKAIRGLSESYQMVSTSLHSDRRRKPPAQRYFSLELTITGSEGGG